MNRVLVCLLAIGCSSPAPRDPCAECEVVCEVVDLPGQAWTGCLERNCTHDCAVVRLTWMRIDDGGTQIRSEVRPR